MVYKPPSVKPPSLCPRCGGPLVSITDDEGNVKGKRCPACGFVTSKGAAARPETIKIRMDEPKKSKEERISIFKMVQDDVAPTTELSSDNVCLILDRDQNKIFIWKGKYTSPGERYRAGTAATRLKSRERLYGAATVIVDEGEEPADFPDLSKLKSQVAVEDQKRKKEEDKMKEEARKKEEEEEAKKKAEEEAKRKAAEEAKEKAEAEAKPSASAEPTAAEDMRIKSLTIIDGIDENVARKLIEINITSVALLATADPSMISEKTGIDADKIRQINQNAKSILGL
ncbi:MAG: hypothetical protein ACTSSI_13025 [Candidatus Helarchaeota archaeon]